MMHLFIVNEFKAKESLPSAEVKLSSGTGFSFEDEDSLDFDGEVKPSKPEFEKANVAQPGMVFHSLVSGICVYLLN